MIITVIISISILIISGCASQDMKRFGYDVLSNYQCSSGEICPNNNTNRAAYQSRCMGGAGLPNCDQYPLNYNEYVDERKDALENIRDNK